jgi:uncharacterized protein DUF945
MEQGARNLKKRWMAVGAAALMIGVAAPWGVGYYTQQQWQGVEAGVNNAQTVFRLETRNYDRSYMNATVNGSVVFTAPESGEQHSFEFQARVSHGVTGSLMDFTSAEDMGGRVSEFFPDKKPRLTLQTNLWGTATVEMTVPETDVIDEATGETLSTARAYGRADISAAGSDMEIQVTWPGMTLSGPDVQFTLTDFEMENSLEHLTGDLWLGDARMTLAGIQIDSADQPAVTFDGLSITSDTNVSDDGERLNGRSSIQLEKVAAGGTEYGPHEVQILFEGLDVTNLEQFSSAISDMQQAAMTSAADPDPQALMQQQMVAFQRVNDALVGLATEGFRFGLPKIDLSTPEGPIQGELMISHPELSAQDKGQNLLVMQGLEGNLDISMPVELMDQNPSLAMQVAPLIKQGMVVQEGDRLRMVGTLGDMALTINDNVLPLPPIF